MEPYKILEDEWSNFTQSKYAVSCSSGTAGLHLALLAFGIKPGDEVIVPDFTMAAVAFAVSYTGATPVFADVDLETYGLAWEEVANKITKKTKAIILVHTYGWLAADRKKIFALAKAANIPVIEDACEAQGAIQKSPAALTVYSFYRNKIIAAEEGGIVTTDDQSFLRRMNYYKNMCFSPQHDYYHANIGYNYRMPNAMAKLALKSLHKYHRNNAKRREIEKWYSTFLEIPHRKHNAVWFYDLPLGMLEAENKDKILAAIPGARMVFKPLSSFPMYGGGPGLTNSKMLSESAVLLPANPELTKKQIEKFCKIINQL